MKSFTTFLLEAGGKNIMGVNPLQMKTRDILRLIRQWKNHVSIDNTGSHNKILDSNGNVVAKFTKGEVGPKGAIDIVSQLRDHLVSRGVYVVRPGESSSLTQKRQNVSVQAKEKSSDGESIPSREERIKNIIDRLKSGSIGQRKRRRLERIVSRARG